MSQVEKKATKKREIKGFLKIISKYCLEDEARKILGKMVKLSIHRNVEFENMSNIFFNKVSESFNHDQSKLNIFLDSLLELINAKNQRNIEGSYKVLESLMQGYSLDIQKHLPSENQTDTDCFLLLTNSIYLIKFYKKDGI